MLQTLVLAIRCSQYAPLLFAVALELSVMAGPSSAGQDSRPPASIIGTSLQPIPDRHQRFEIPGVSVLPPQGEN
jgi:hypothetical protein